MNKSRIYPDLLLSLVCYPPQMGVYAVTHNTVHPTSQVL